MFTISLHDIRPMDDVEQHLEARRCFLDKHHAAPPPPRHAHP